jgi:dihydrofolate reductase
MFRLIVATDVHHGIAKDNQIPWTLKKDLTFFKETTSLAPSPKKNVIIMGRKTHEAMGQRVLPNRINIVLTTNTNYQVPGIIPCTSLKEAITYCHNLSNLHHVYIIGGQQVYQEALQSLPIEYIYKTIVHADASCDRFFPDITHSHELVSQSTHERENNLTFHIEVWRRNAAVTPPLSEWFRALQAAGLV